MKKKIIYLILLLLIVSTTFHFMNIKKINNYYDQTITPKNSYNTYYVSIPSKIILDPKKETTKMNVYFIPTKNYKLSNWQDLELDITINANESSRIKEYYFVYNKKNYKKPFTLNFNEKLIKKNEKKLKLSFYTYLQQRDQDKTYDTIMFNINEKKVKYKGN